MRLWRNTKETTQKAGEIAKQIVTFGGYAALNDSSAALNVQLEKHRESVRTFETANSAFMRAVEGLGCETSACIALLRASQDFVQRLSYSAFSSKLPNLPVFRTPDLSKVVATLSTFDATITAGKGAGLGLAASTGAWVLVAHLGTASTGAAISGLVGAAAHNAILAWFGGGALAAGGGGMLLGGLTISAIAFLLLPFQRTGATKRRLALISKEKRLRSLRQSIVIMRTSCFA
jgi:hypothetical protein